MRIRSPHLLPEGPSNPSLLAEPHHSKHSAGFLFNSLSFNMKKDYLPSEELLGDHSQNTRWFLRSRQGFL